MHIATLINNKLQKGEPQTFDRLSDENINALETQKATLIDSPLLAFPRSQEDYAVDIDASNRQIGSSYYSRNWTEVKGQSSTGLV